MTPSVPSVSADLDVCLPRAGVVRVRSPEVGVIVLDEHRREVVEPLSAPGVVLPHRPTTA